MLAKILLFLILALCIIGIGLAAIAALDTNSNGIYDGQENYKIYLTE